MLRSVRLNPRVQVLPLRQRPTLILAKYIVGGQLALGELPSASSTNETTVTWFPAGPLTSTSPVPVASVPPATTVSVVCSIGTADPGIVTVLVALADAPFGTG